MYRWLSIVFCLLTFACQKEGKRLASLSIFAPEGINIQGKSEAHFIYNDNWDVQEFDGSVKYRGGYSLRYAKKSYGIELKSQVSLGGMPSEDDWVLNANYVDKTFIRHKLGYDLFRKMGEDNIAPLSNYIEVFENDSPKGLFVLMQKLTPKILGVKKKDTKALVFKEPPIFYIDEMLFQDSVNIFQQKYPQFKKEDKKDILLEFRKFLFQSSEREFSNDIHQWIDIDNVTDWLIILLLANAGDNIVKNFYLYKKDAQTPFRIALWDFDHSFGRDGDNELSNSDKPINLKRSILFVRLWNNPYLNFNQRLVERWHELRNSNIISAYELNRMIDCNVQIILPYISMNSLLWPLNSPDYYDDNSFNEELTLMKTFIKMRIRDLDKLYCYPD
ncbi:MAG: CotH kinase family protein [Chitinophagales bacterium]|nr:CotH kinase family protein [Chitinophagales bacterium]